MIRALLLWAALAGPAAAGPGAAALEARAQLERMSARLEAAQSARDRVAALTETLQAYESGLVALRDGLRRAAVREQTLTRALAAKSGEVAQLLAVLQSMEQAPAPLLLLHPSGPVGTARSGMLVADVTPALQAQVDDLRAQLAEVAQLRAAQDGAVDVLRAGLMGAQQARHALAEAIDDRTDLPRRYVEDPIQTALLIASTETLTEFAQMLAQLRPDVAPPAPDVARGALAPPIAGPVLRGYGETDAAGLTRPGVVIAARRRGLVTVPAPATLRFKGPLLDYGTVAILEPAADVLFVVAGLAEVFGTPGEVLPQGAPLGLMGGDPLEHDADLTTKGGVDRSESLYLEVREHGKSVNPSEWFVLE